MNELSGWNLPASRAAGCRPTSGPRFDHPIAHGDRRRARYCWDRIHFTKASASSGETPG
jgi:hypothetical protein